jgi:membrane protein
MIMADAAHQTGSRQAERGREATTPSEIPRPGWRDIALRVKNETSKDNVDMVAAGVAFYALMAIFPALIALISLYGWFADPAQIQQQITSLSGVLPQNAQDLLSSQMQNISRNAQSALGIGAIAGFLFTLWSASKGMKALFTALNIAYDEEEKRGFITLNALAIVLTLGALVFGIVALALIAILPALLGQLGLEAISRIAVSLVRWPLLAVVVMFALAVLYRYGPSRDRPRWNWVSWGAVVATVLWLVASILFSVYVSNFGSYNKTYGSLGAVVVLLMWLYLSAYIVLMGAEFNSEMEHQTVRDTTRGEEQPMGQRGAQKADTLGESP